MILKLPQIVITNLKITVSILFAIFSRTMLQTLTVVPGKHAILFGVIGGVMFGWQAAKNGNKETITCLNFAVLGGLYSLSAAIIGSILPIKFATSILIGFSWVIIVLQAEYNEKICYISKDQIKLSLKSILFGLLGSIPFIGFSLFYINKIISNILDIKNSSFSSKSNSL